MLRVIRVPATAAGRWLRSIKPERRYLRADLTAGLPGAISMSRMGWRPRSWSGSILCKACMPPSRVRSQAASARVRG